MTEQRKKFADKYFETLNATQSAIFAGYSEATARQQAYNILQDDEVQEYLQKLRDEYAEKSGITKERLIEEYKKIAFSNISELYSSDDALLAIKQVDESTIGAVSSIKTRELVGNDGIPVGSIVEVKLHDKLRALDSLGKHLGFFEKDNDQKKTSINIDMLTPEEKRKRIDELKSKLSGE